MTLALVAGGARQRRRLAAERAVLRLEHGTALPLSYAGYVVVARACSPAWAVGIVVAFEALWAIVHEPREWRTRAASVAQRSTVGAATIAGYQASDRFLVAPEHLGGVIAVLLIAMASGYVADTALRLARRQPATWTPRGVRAWLALGSCGVLMAFGLRGVHGAGALGAWSPVLFSLPLLATWYSFQRLDAAARTHRQTLEALARAPELAGLVPAGHSSRVAQLGRSIARELGLDDALTADLEAAAYLHHLGALVTDERHASRVATADTLRQIPQYRDAAEIVAGDALPSWERRGGRDLTLAAQILHVASAYDDLTAGDATRSRGALERLHAEPDELYDLRVLAALERSVVTG